MGYKISNISWICILLILTFGCQRQPNNQAQGYIEGRYTYMATNVAGRLESLHVKRGNVVKSGQPLFVLEMQPESDAYQEAIENVEESRSARDAIQANLGYAKITYERYKVLVPKGAIEQAQLDNAKSIYYSTIAQLAQANATVAENNANLAQAKWKMEQKTVNAPVDAVVFDTYYRLGEYVEENKSVLSLLAPTDIKVVFYIPELYLGNIKLNDIVHVRCDGCEKVYPGKVSFISPTAEYTPPVIYSNETSAKLIYRIEASFAPADAVHLHPGQPVSVTYNLPQNRHVSEAT